LYGNEPSAIGVVFSIFANVIGIGGNGRILNFTYAQRRATDYLKYLHHMKSGKSGVRSQYLMGLLDAKGDVLDGAKVYKVTLPKDIPAKAFWSFTLYDSQTRSMLQTPQNYPRAGSQSYPSPAAEAAEDGSTTIWFSPNQPTGVDRGNWIQTDPDKGWFTILRLYSPLPSFFDKSWRPSEIEMVR
jgi:hypothetical protein